MISTQVGLFVKHFNRLKIMRIKTYTSYVFARCRYSTVIFRIYWLCDVRFAQISPEVNGMRLDLRVISVG